MSDDRFYHVGGPADAITHTYREPPACLACNNHSKVHNHDQPGDDLDRGRFLTLIFWAGVVLFAIILIAMWIIR